MVVVVVDVVVAVANNRDMLSSVIPHLICALGGAAAGRNSRSSCGHIGGGVEHNVMLVVDVAAPRCRAVGDVAGDDAHLGILTPGRGGEGRCTCGCDRGVASCVTSATKDSEGHIDERVGERVTERVRPERISRAIERHVERGMRASRGNRGTGRGA